MMSEDEKWLVGDSDDGDGVWRPNGSTSESDSIDESDLTFTDDSEDSPKKNRGGKKSKNSVKREEKKPR